MQTENDPVFIIRLPSTNIENSVNYFKSQGFKVIEAEEVINTVWIQKNNFTFSVCECAAEHPMLVMYWEKPDQFLMKLEELSVICNFAVDHQGNHFEALFTDPAGLTIITADKNDLPEKCRSADYSDLYEFSLPSVPSFSDSINFWNQLGFNPVPDKPRPHSWSRMKMDSFTIGIHQSPDWQRPGLVFEGSSPFNNEIEIYLDLKNCGTAKVSETCDHTLLYQIISD